MKFLGSLLLCVIAFSSLAQKKTLSHTVYDQWKEIGSKALTPDGKFAAITINPQDGDGRIVFYNLKAGTQDSVKRGDNVSLTYDNKYAVFKIKPQQKIVKALRRQKKKKEDLPKDSLAIYSFATRKTEKIADVKTYRVPEKAGGWVAYTLEAKKEEKPKAGEKPKKVKKNTDDNGYTLLLRNLDDNKTTQYPFVRDFVFARNGSGLLFTTSGDSSIVAGIYWYDLKTNQLKSLHGGRPKYKYKGLSISEDGTQAAFLLDADTTKALIRHPQLFVWKSGEVAAKHFDIENSLALPVGWLLSDNQTPWFLKITGYHF